MEKQVKHPFCGGKAILKAEDLKLNGAAFTIKDAHYYKCTKCGEEYSTSGQMRELDRKLKAQMKLVAKASN